MDLFIFLKLYIFVSVALAITSYVMLFRPTIRLVEEIIEEDCPYGGLFGLIMWNIFSTLVAPYTLFILLQNNNEKFIEQLAVAFANKLIDKEEDEE